MAGTESERANLPVYRGRTGTFESWFMVVFEPKRGRGYWIRYEVVVPEGGSGVVPCGILAVHLFDAKSDAPVRFAKRFVPLEKVSFGPETRFHVRFDDAEMGHGFSRGSAGSGDDTIRWNLRFTTQRAPSERTPSLLRHLPLPNQREHPHTEVRFDGSIEVGGVVEEIRWAVGAQVHAYGERRMEERRWVYVPELAEDESAALELVQTRVERKVLGLPAPAFASLWLRTASEELDLTELRDGWMHKVDALATGSIHARSVSANRAIVVHAHAPHAALAAHRLVDPDGDERFQVKSAIADVTVEIFERPSRIGRFRPKQLLTAKNACAVEITGTEPGHGIDYCGFYDTKLPKLASRESQRSPSNPGIRGAFEEFPEAIAIYTASFSYPSDGEEIGYETKADSPVLLAKSHRTLKTSGEIVRMPESATIVDSLLAIEPGLSKVLGSRYGFLPALLDYEVELGIVLFEDVSLVQLADPGFAPRIGWFVANDLTARVCQLFGHGQADPRPYWELGKSFAGFCPASPKVFVPERSRLDVWPDIPLRTIVNGQVRQQANAQQIVHTPRELLNACVRRRGGNLEPGVVVLTGTPAGVAYRMPNWRRAIEDRLLDRYGKLEAAFNLYLESPDFLRPGDRVVVDAGFLGSRDVVIG